MELQPDSWFIIVNPTAGNGKAARTWKKLHDVLSRTNINHQFAETKYHGHATELAKNAILAGGRRILALGGDGTAHETVNGIFQSNLAPEDILFGLVTAGTGNDWVKTVGKHGAISSIPQSLQAARSTSYDAGLVHYRENGEGKSRFFLNIAGLGFDGAVVKSLTESNGWLSRTPFKYWAVLLQSLWTYQHTPLQFEIDGSTFDFSTLSVAAGIGNFNGGGFKQLPFANYNDGKLDMTIITTMPKWKMITNLHKLNSGSFTNMKQVHVFQAENIRINSKEKVFVEADGEFLGETPVHIEIIPSALRILMWQ